MILTGKQKNPDENLTQCHCIEVLLKTILLFPFVLCYEQLQLTIQFEFHAG